MVGADLIEIDRIRKAINRTSRFCTRVFTPGEIEYCNSKANPFPSFAVRFAAKEAFRKLHPAFTSGIKFQEVEVVNDPGGRPRYRLRGEALARVKKLNIARIDLSLSHSGNYAMAVAVAVAGKEEGRDEDCNCCRDEDY
ncbi:MAG: holo-ACP synthase [Syntrophomonadaceae bacterium]|nr:holo-ACP synthase [Syntrophomonadaceae bacterium]